MLTFLVNRLTKFQGQENMQDVMKYNHKKYMNSLGLPIIDMDILHTIHQIKKELEAKAVSDLSNFKLSMPQIDILANLLIHGATTSTGLAELLRVSKANLTGMISRLEERKYVIRKDSETDGRSKIIELTDEGRSLMEKLIPSYFENMSNVMAVIPDEEKQSLVSNLELILDAVIKYKNTIK